MHVVEDRDSTGAERIRIFCGEHCPQHSEKPHKEWTGEPKDMGGVQESLF